MKKDFTFEAFTKSNSYVALRFSFKSLIMTEDVPSISATVEPIVVRSILVSETAKIVRVHRNNLMNVLTFVLFHRF